MRDGLGYKVHFFVAPSVSFRHQPYYRYRDVVSCGIVRIISEKTYGVQWIGADTLVLIEFHNFCGGLTSFAIRTSIRMVQISADPRVTDI